MEVVAALLMLAASPDIDRFIHGPPVHDIDRMPSAEVTYEALRLNWQYREYLDEVQLLACWKEPWCEGARSQNGELRAAWSSLCNAHWYASRLAVERKRQKDGNLPSEGYDGDDELSGCYDDIYYLTLTVRWHLRKLCDTIGQDAYLWGRMPPVVPTELLRRID